MTLKILLQTTQLKKSHWDVLFRSMRAFSCEKSPIKMLTFLSQRFFLRKINVGAHWSWKIDVGVLYLKHYIGKNYRKGM